MIVYFHNVSNIQELHYQLNEIFPNSFVDPGENPFSFYIELYEPSEATLMILTLGDKIVNIE